MDGKTKGFVVGLIVGIAAYHVMVSKGTALSSKK